MEMEMTPAVHQENKRFPDGFRVLQGKREYITYLEHSSVRVWPSNRPGHYETHMHSAVEIILPQRGTSVYRVDGRLCRVEAGQILIIPSGMPHELTEGEDILRYLILFEPNILYGLLDMMEVSQITQRLIYLSEPSPLRSRVTELLMQLADCYLQRKPMWNTGCYALLLQVYALLGAECLRGEDSRAAAAPGNIDAEIMNMAINYIGDHYMDSITLEEVASFVGYSKYYFSRTFKQYFGVSFSDHLLNVRLGEATNALIRSDRPIRDVAREAGFGSVASFNRIFRAHKDCTPTQYRAIYGVHDTVRARR